jgi:hypothetical protein
MKKFKNPLAVNENDTIGSAIIKGAAEGYIKGTLVGLVSLGVLTVGLVTISKFAESDEEEVKPEDNEKELEDLEKELEERIKEFDEEIEKYNNMIH